MERSCESVAGVKTVGAAIDQLASLKLSTTVAVYYTRTGEGIGRPELLVPDPASE